MSYKSAEIEPYRRAAVAWLEANAEDLWVRNAIDRVKTLCETAGPHVEAFRLRGLSPEERSRAAWARLRAAKVDPHCVIAAWLAVEMKTKADPQAESKAEFKQVQAAKLVHRLASGTHKRWENAPGGPKEIHVYPRSRGRVLRHIGKALDEACGLLVENRLRSIMETQEAT